MHDLFNKEMISTCPDCSLDIVPNWKTYKASFDTF